MDRRPFGPSGRRVSVIGQGTWYIDSADRDSAIATLRRGLDLGMDHIDTSAVGEGAMAVQLVHEYLKEM